MADHFEYTKRRARKTWKCAALNHACGGPIEPGERYVQIDHVEGQARWTNRYAWACATLAFGTEFMQVLEVQGVLPPRPPAATADERRFRRMG
jgi:hypothetical protein